MDEAHGMLSRVEREMGERRMFQQHQQQNNNKRGNNSNNASQQQQQPESSYLLQLLRENERLKELLNVPTRLEPVSAMKQQSKETSTTKNKKKVTIYSSSGRKGLPRASSCEDLSDSRLQQQHLEMHNRCLQNQLRSLPAREQQHHWHHNEDSSSFGFSSSMAEAEARLREALQQNAEMGRRIEELTAIRMHLKAKVCSLVVEHRIIFPVARNECLLPKESKFACVLARVPRQHVWLKSTHLMMIDWIKTLEFPFKVDDLTKQQQILVRSGSSPDMRGKVHELIGHIEKQRDIYKTNVERLIARLDRDGGGGSKKNFGISSNGGREEDDDMQVLREIQNSSRLMLSRREKERSHSSSGHNNNSSNGNYNSSSGGNNNSSETSYHPSIYETNGSNGGGGNDVEAVLRLEREIEEVKNKLSDLRREKSEREAELAEEISRLRRDKQRLGQDLVAMENRLREYERGGGIRVSVCRYCVSICHISW